MADQKKSMLSEKEYRHALKELQKGGLSKLATLSQVTLAGLAAAGTVSSAGAIAAALGLTVTTVVPATVFGITLPGWLVAGTVVSTTPLGWTIAIGAVAFGITFGIINFFRSEGQHEERMQQTKKGIIAKLEKIQGSSDDEKIKGIAEALEVGFKNKIILPQYGSRIITHLHSGSMTPESAINAVIDFLSSESFSSSLPLNSEEMFVKECLGKLEKDDRERVIKLVLKGKIAIEQIPDFIERAKLDKVGNIIKKSIFERIEKGKITVEHVPDLIEQIAIRMARMDAIEREVTFDAVQKGKLHADRIPYLNERHTT